MNIHEVPLTLVLHQCHYDIKVQNRVPFCVTLYTFDPVVIVFKLQFHSKVFQYGQKSAQILTLDRNPTTVHFDLD